MNFLRRLFSPTHVVITIVDVGERIVRRADIDFMAPDLTEDPENLSFIRIGGLKYSITKAEYARLKSILT